MSKPRSRCKSRRKIIYESSDEENNKYSNKNEVQVLNNIISLNHRPITILVPNEQIKPETTTSACSPTQKIPRPANAFMIFANENRKKVAKEFPQESNKEISCRLGMQWKNLSSKEKEKYFSMAKLLDADHKRKYPDYVYNPKEARIRKAMRERERSMGAAQMGSARSRRPAWPKTPIHMPPGPGPAAHPDHLLGTPSKELCSALRAEMEHGFLAGNGGYVYPSQQYQFSPQSDYATYIQVAPGLSNWVQNQYNMQQQGNTLAQQQIWNQYQTERLRAQQTAGSSYLMNPQSQTPDYQHMDHMPLTNSMQIGPTSSMKSAMHQNVDNAASDVERYMNIPSTMSSTSTTTKVEVRSPVAQQLQTVDNTAVPSRSVASCTPIPAVVDATEDANGPASDDMVNGTGQETTTPAELNISNVTAMSEVDAQINNMETAGNSSDTSFGGFSLLDDANLTNIGSDMHKKRAKPNSEDIPPAHSNFRKIEVDPLQPLFPMDFVSGRPAFLPQNNYIMDNFIPELSNPYSDPENMMINRPEFPVDFSAQKYYESVANGNFDGPLLTGEPFGNYICDDGYSFLTFPNPQDISNPCTFPSSQFEVTQFLNDPSETRLVNNENNFILDLSNVPQNEEQIDIGVEKNANEASNKICDELSNIV